MPAPRFVLPIGALWLVLSHPTLAQATAPDSLLFSSVTAGATHTCALTTKGRVYCWGSNGEGELGAGNRADSPLPVAVAGATRFLGIDAGTEFACGVATTGEAYCWGRNTTGALGNAATPRSLAPAPVTGGLLFRGVTAGADHACGVADDGVAYCWGANAQGQLGTGDTLPSTRPLPVTGALRFIALTAGDGHTCGIARDSLAYCWGTNRRGELGVGLRGERRGPQAVARHYRWRSLSAGAHHTCGLTADRRPIVFCWGDNFHEQINPRRTPMSRGDPILWAPTFVAQPFDLLGVSAGRWHSCLARGHSATAVTCWGANFDFQLGRLVIGSFVQVSAGEAHTCALRRDGAVYCWGRNSAGQLGDGTRFDEPRPVRVADSIPEPP
ncbi:MAG: RCC1 domain-containing protein [Gemmatimonadales bacterium]